MDDEPRHVSRLPGKSCRACRGSELQPSWVVDGYPLVRCLRCGSLTTDCEMAPAAARKFYGRGYFHGGDYADYQSSESTAKQNFARFIERMKARHLGRRLLEIGCAYGYFLDLASREWDVEGIDVSSDAASEASRKFPGRVYCGDVATTELQRAPYDWVVAWDTIEHMDAPAGAASRAFELLSPGGHLALTTGDISSSLARFLGRRWRLLTPPSHLTFFSAEGMQRMLSDAGFCDVRFTTAGYSRSFDFTLYRLLGSSYERFIRGSRLRDWLKRRSYYIDLFDVMFVTARRPE